MEIEGKERGVVERKSGKEEGMQGKCTQGKKLQGSPFFQYVAKYIQLMLDLVHQI